MKTFFLIALAIPAFAQVPQFLRPGEADILPTAIRERMVIAEQKISEARTKYQTWIRAQPRPGYVGTVEQRHREFLAAHKSAQEAVWHAMNGIQGLSRSSRNIVLGWAKEARKRLNRRQPGAPHPVFYL